jgi:hypothetical protein
VEDAEEQSKQTPSSTISSTRDALLESFPQDLQTNGAQAIISYLNGPFAEIALKTNDRDNFLLLKHLSYELCSNNIPFESAEMAEQVTNTLIEKLEDFERDPEKCSSSYHVRLQL